MLFFVFVLVLIVGIVWFVNNEDSMMSVICIVLGGLATFVSLFIIMGSSINTPILSLQYSEWQTAIEYKISSGLYTDSLDILDKDIVDEISRYNQRVISGKHLQRDFWIGIYIENAYDDIEVIDYEILTRSYMVP